MRTEEDNSFESDGGHPMRNTAPKVATTPLSSTSADANVMRKTATLRIGTWNLERSGAMHRSRVSRQLEAILQRNADIWVLTETHESVAIPGYHGCTSDRSPGYHAEGEHCVAIWSRYPLGRVHTRDSEFTVAASIELPAGQKPLLVYGTIITYGQDGVAQRQAMPWERHRAAVARQTAEWQELQQAYPDHRLCVAGDFNENLDGTRWYGVQDAKDAIARGLDSAGMRCLTTANLRAEPYADIRRASVDHICFTDAAGLESKLEAWPGRADGMPLSDHNGVLVELILPGGQ